MTILSVVKDVCATVGVMVPTSLFSGIGTNRTAQEMLALANEMGQRIAYDTRDWTVLRKSLPPPYYVGDGHYVPPQPDPLATWTGTTAFNLPADYKRMLLTSQVWRSTDSRQPMRFIPDTDEWLQRRAAGETDAWGEWTLYGGQIHIWPIMGGLVPEIPGPPVVPAVPATTARFTYLDRNCVALFSGGFGDRFVNDADVYRLDERLLKLGMIWQWKAQKGSPYAEDMGSYSDALQIAMGKDSPSPTIVGARPISDSVRVAYPWPVSGPVWPLS